MSAAATPGSKPYYFVPQPSHWPITGSLALLLMGTGAAFWFNGYAPDGEWFFAVAMGLYPNRRVIDAAISVVHGGVQRSVFASGRAPLDPAETRVGPIAIEVVQPLRTLRVRADAAHLGIERRAAGRRRHPPERDGRRS